MSQFDNIDEDDCDTKLAHVAGLIKQGYTSGVHPAWTLKIAADASDDDREHIAKLVSEGFTSGAHPNWSIVIH
jgi:hypothetical protein